jgi:hypothetical protein
LPGWGALAVPIPGLPVRAERVTQMRQRAAQIAEPLIDEAEPAPYARQIGS